MYIRNSESYIGASIYFRNYFYNSLMYVQYANLCKKFYGILGQCGRGVVFLAMLSTLWLAQLDSIPSTSGTRRRDPW